MSFSYQALRRCSYRCPVSGQYDSLAPNRPPGFSPLTLEAAHIIPHSLGQAGDETEVCHFLFI